MTLCYSYISQDEYDILATKPRLSVNIKDRAAPAYFDGIGIGQVCTLYKYRFFCLCNINHEIAFFSVIKLKQ